MQDTQADRARRLLHLHRPFDALERRHVIRALDLVEGGGPVDKRDHYDPGHLTASGFVLSPDRHEVLLVEHVKLNRWLQPGGHMESSDASFEAAALREVREETGLTDLARAPEVPGLFDVDVHLIGPHCGEPEHLHYDLRYVFLAPHRNVRAGEGVRDARFWSLDGIENRFDMPSLHRPFLKLRRALGKAARGAAG